MAGALVNLLERRPAGNAAGGKIYLGGKICPAGVVFTVRDGGPGVLHEKRERIFEPFLPPKGREPVSGWRLPAVARAHGGTIELSSAPRSAVVADGDASGAEFVMTLPVGVGLGEGK